jgi:hypothetical protein
MSAFAAGAALALLIAGSTGSLSARAADARGEDVLSSEPGRMAPLPGEDALTTLPLREPGAEEAPAPALLPPEPAVHAESGIEVLNGSGYGGHAAYWAKRLRGQGLRVVRVADADRLDHRQTLIYYAEGLEKTAVEVRRALGRTGKLEFRKPSGRRRVVVVLGRDLPREAREEIPGKGPASR